jgi:tetratricopeptide (TPR) repeat protein
LIAGIIILTTHSDVINLRGKFVYDYTILERFFLKNYGLFNYILKIFWPTQLCAIYPYPEKIGSFFSPMFYLSSIFITAIIAAIFILEYKNKKLFIFCTLFFFYTIFANLPFSVIGEAVIADRYVYIPCIGIFILVGFLSFKLLDSKRNWLLAPIAMYCLWFFVLTFNQCQIWKNGITLWTDVIKKNPDLGFAYYNRGVINSDKKNYEAAISDFTQVIQRGPIYLALDAYTNRGEVYAISGQYEQAVQDLTRVLQINPRAFMALNNRGLVYMYQKKYDEAINNFNQAIVIRPEFVDGYNNRGVTYMLKREFEPALADFHKTISLNIRYAPAYYNMSKIYFTMKNIPKAKESFVRALSLGYKPENFYSAIMESLLRSP